MSAALKSLKTEIPLWRLCDSCEGVFCIGGKLFLNKETYRVRHCPFCASTRLKDVPDEVARRMDQFAWKESA